MRDTTTTCSSSCGGFAALFWPLSTPAFTCTYPLPYTWMEKRNLICNISPGKDSRLHSAKVHGRVSCCFLPLKSSQCHLPSPLGAVPALEVHLTVMSAYSIKQPHDCQQGWPVSSLQWVGQIHCNPKFPPNDIIAISQSCWTTQG